CRSVSRCAMGLMALIAAGCSSDSPKASVDSVAVTGSAATSTTAGQPVGTSGTSPGTEVSTTVAAGATTAAPTTAAVPLGGPEVAFNQIGKFSLPVDLTFRPTDGLIYVVEQDGKVVIMDNGQP